MALTLIGRRPVGTLRTQLLTLVEETLVPGIHLGQGCSGPVNSALTHSSSQRTATGQKCVQLAGRGGGLLSRCNLSAGCGPSQYHNHLMLGMALWTCFSQRLPEGPQ